MYVGEDISDVGHAMSIQVIAGDGFFYWEMKTTSRQKAKGTRMHFVHEKKSRFSPIIS